jgi:DNA-binding SARP family transcriptional activator/tRNA A-37 threonylcarbamoyl transferase component Bud32
LFEASALMHLSPMATDVEDLALALTDRYTVERELGRGATAVVYLATDLKHGRRVALKLLKSLDASVSHQRFLDEIRTTARLHHPHLLPLYDSGEAGKRLFFSMPYVEAGTLRERLRGEGKLPVDVALRITEQVGRALAYAHTQGIVHRDVKPENIMLSSGGDALVTDFGIAYALDEARRESTTGEGIVVGTPSYMSPEQLLGARILDGRSDLYSLACVLFEMLAGQPPFVASDVRELLHRRLHEDAPSVRTVCADVPGGVERALRRALTRNPVDRFATIADFLAALHQPSVFRVLTLGGLTVLGDEKPMPASRLSPQALALLAMLVHAGQRGVGRDDALRLLWPRADTEEARRLLARTIRALRREFGFGQSVSGGRVLFLHGDVTSDVADFRAALANGQVERAISTYQGPFLQGLLLPDSPAFDQWMRQTRHELEIHFHAALEQAARAATSRRDHAHAMLYWRRLSAEDPLNARVARGYMLALAASGDRPGAIRHAELYQALIDQEIGVPPDLEVIALADSMRRGDDVSGLADTLEHETPSLERAEPKAVRRRSDGTFIAIALLLAVALAAVAAYLLLAWRR